MKVRRGELTNTRLTQKHESGRVKKISKDKCNVSLVIKEFLMIKNGCQYTYYENLIKNKIYPKISHNGSL